MTATASGSLSLAQENLRQMLAAVPAVQTWLGATDPDTAVATALLRIYHEGFPSPAAGQDAHTADDLKTIRPCAVVYTDEDRGFSQVMEAVGHTFEFQERGKLKLRLYQNCPDSLGDEPTSDANLLWKNTIGAIIDGLCALSGQPGYLAFHALHVDAGPYWGHPKEVPTQGVWQGVEISLEWRGL